MTEKMCTNLACSMSCVV